MAKNKKTIEDMKNDLQNLEQKIENYAKKLSKLKQEKQSLKEKIKMAQLFEIKGLLDERHITYEQAKEILNQANPVLNSQTQKNEEI